MTVLRRTSQLPKRTVGRHVSVVLHHRFKILTYKTQKGCMGKGCWPHPWVRSLSRDGPGATVGTLRTGYPRVQASSQDNGSSSCLPERGNSGAVTCPRGSGSQLGAAPGLPRTPTTPAPSFWLRVAPGLTRVPRMSSTGYKQLNKYPLVTRPS
jgi:hypothetical protein